MPADRPEDVDEAFARLVARYDTPVDDAASWPEAENVRDDEPDVERPHEPEPASEATHPSARAPASDSDPLVTEATWEDEGHFVPPTPPPLPRPAPVRLAAWLGVLVGPVLMTIVAALGWRLPSILTAVLVIGFVGGVVYLIATMTDRPHDPYDGDDGAVV